MATLNGVEITGKESTSKFLELLFAEADRVGSAVLMGRLVDQPLLRRMMLKVTNELPSLPKALADRFDRMVGGLKTAISIDDGKSRFRRPPTQAFRWEQLGLEDPDQQEKPSYLWVILSALALIGLGAGWFLLKGRP